MMMMMIIVTWERKNLKLNFQCTLEKLGSFSELVEGVFVEISIIFKLYSSVEIDLRRKRPTN